MKMENAERIRQMSNSKFWDWLYERRGICPKAITPRLCRGEGCLKCWQEFFKRCNKSLEKFPPIYINCLLHSYCPPPIECPKNTSCAKCMKKKQERE